MKAKLELQLTNATINPEKAGGDDGETGSALRFDGDVLCEKLSGLFSTEESYKAVLAGLYGDGHDLKTGDVENIALSIELEKVKAKLLGPVAEDERLAFTGCRLNGITLKPKHGRAVGITLKLYVHPEAGQWAKIVDLCKKTVTLQLSGGAEVEEKPAAQASLPMAATTEVATDAGKPH